MRVRCVYGRQTIFETRLTIQAMERVAGRHGITTIMVVAVVGAHEGSGQGTVVGGIVSGGRVHTVPQVQRLTDRDAILAIVDSSTISENVDICAFRAEFAISL